MKTENEIACTGVSVPPMVEVVKFGMMSAMVVSGMITDRKAEVP